MSESCILLQPRASEAGMRRGSGLGMTARDAVDEVDGLGGEAERSSQSKPLSLKIAGSPKHVTDGSETSENTRMVTNDASQPQNEINKNGKRAFNLMDTENTSDEQEEESKAAEEGGPISDVSTNRNPSVPQHEQLDETEDAAAAVSSDTHFYSMALKVKQVLLSRLSLSADMGRLQVIDLSRRGLGAEDAGLVMKAIIQNPNLSVLKLGYNNFGDDGTAAIASACVQNGVHHHHLNLVDLGFNAIGDRGCAALALHLVAGNYQLRTIYLSGNNIKQKGAVSIAGAILHGCGLSCLHMSANKLGPVGVKVLAGAIAQSEARRITIQQQTQMAGLTLSGGIVSTMEELHLGDTMMKPEGYIALPSMLLTNANLRIINLANNDIDDGDMALLSQALSQNKNVPIASLGLSFNKITCVGVECLMNAIWGSQTLQEIKLDSNKIQDRGAQLCSVVLGSVRLEVLNLAFNRISTVGIKAIMKSLSENETLKRVSMAGIPMDQNASKAVSYALAYNSSLCEFNVDSCCIGYSAQRHFVAGIVSNRNVSLRILTGFPLGPITVTLGLPQVPEDWSNDKVLNFVRFMWRHWRNTQPQNSDAAVARGPAPPSAVAAAARKAFAYLGESPTAALNSQEPMDCTQPEASPLLPPEAALLERTDSGNLQVPVWHDELENADGNDFDDSWSSESDSEQSSHTDSSNSLNAAVLDPARRSKNLQWLRMHHHALGEIANLVFNNADLWQLHQYFFSPVYDNTEDGNETEGTGTNDAEHGDDEKVEGGKITDNSDPPHTDSTSDKKDSQNETPSGRAVAPPPTPALNGMSKSPSMGRAISFQTLGEAVAKAALPDTSGPNKRRSSVEVPESSQPCAKRAKSLKPRIAYYPRIREKLESLGTKPSTQTLSLLRQMKYIENVMLQGKNVYTEPLNDKASEWPSSSDVEMILLDLI